MTKFVTKSNTHQQFCSFCSSHSRCIHADDVQVYRAGVEDLPHPYSAHQIGVMILHLHGQQECSASVTVALTQQSRFFDCRAGATSLSHLGLETLGTPLNLGIPIIPKFRIRKLFRDPTKLSSRNPLKWRGSQRLRAPYQRRLDVHASLNPAATTDPWQYTVRDCRRGGWKRPGPKCLVSRRRRRPCGSRSARGGWRCTRS